MSFTFARGQQTYILGQKSSIYLTAEMKKSSMSATEGRIKQLISGAAQSPVFRTAYFSVDKIIIDFGGSKSLSVIECIRGQYAISDIQSNKLYFHGCLGRHHIQSDQHCRMVTRSFFIIILHKSLFLAAHHNSGVCLHD